MGACCLNSDSYAFSSLESFGCNSRDSNELMEIDCLLLHYLYCLYELICMLAVSVLDGIELKGFPSSGYMHVLFIFSLLRMILPTLFLVVSIGLPSFDLYLFSLYFLHKFYNILRSVSLNEQGSVFTYSIQITFVFEGQQIAIYLLELNASFGVDCFSGRLFFGAVLEGIFFTDFGFDLGYEAIDFLADCGLSVWMTISNLIFFALFPLYSREGVTFCCLSGPLLGGRYSLPHFSLIASTAGVYLGCFWLSSLASSLYCCNSFIILSSHMSQCPLRCCCSSGGLFSRTFAACLSIEVLPNFLKWWVCWRECQLSWERNELYRIVNYQQIQQTLIGITQRPHPQSATLL